MATEFTADEALDYHETRMYKLASPERRRQLNRYKKECGISDEHMLLLLLKQDLDGVPEDQRKGQDFIATCMLVIGVLLLWNSLQVAMSNPGGANVPLIFLSLGSFLLVWAIYAFGLLNPYKRTVRQVTKRLKDMPEVPDFVEWDTEHPNRQDRRAARR